MKKSTRRILFYSFIAIFLVIGSIIVLIAFGYGYDFTQNKVVKTGALGVTTNVKASVYINDEMEGETSFLSNSFDKNRLIPGVYQVRAEGQGLRPWQKKVNIDAGLYADFPSIYLVPENLNQEVVAETVSHVSKLLYGNWLVYFSKNGFFTYRNTDNETSTEYELNSNTGTAITKKFQTVLFDQERNLFLLSSGASSYTLDPVNNLVTTLGRLPFTVNNGSYFHDGIVYSLVRNQLMSYDTEVRKGSIIIKNVSSLAFGGDSVSYINTVDDQLYLQSLANTQVSGPFELETGISKILKVIPHENGNFFILQGSGRPAMFRVVEDKLAKISSYATDAILSPSRSKLLFFNPNEVSVFYLTTTGKQPYREQGDIDLIDRTTATIGNPAWFSTEEYMLFTKDQRLIFTELDGRGNRNSYDLADNIISFAFEYDSNTLYTTNNSSISKIVIP